MKKEEFIERRGEAAYKNYLEYNRQWREANPKKIDKQSRKQCRKGAKGYAKKRLYGRTGIPGEKNKIRALHGLKWRQYKNIIAPSSQLHHQWQPSTSEYDGVALVEANQHQHGIIDVIRILDGEVTIFTEKELRERGEIA